MAKKNTTEIIEQDNIIEKQVSEVLTKEQSQDESHVISYESHAISYEKPYDTPSLPIIGSENNISFYKEPPIRFALTRNVKAPNRANPTDAGIDFYVPKFDENMINALILANPQFSRNTFTDYINTTEINGEIKKYFYIKQHERILIPSGVKCKMQNGTKAFIAFNKSGVSTKTGLTVGACVVDIDYQGEIHISLINTSSTPVMIHEDMKAVQFIEIPIYCSDIEITDEKNLYSDTTSRGDKGFGSHDNI